VERRRASIRGNKASNEFAEGIVKVVDVAVDALRNSEDDEVERASLRETYTEGVAAAVIGFADVSKALLQGIAGKEKEAEDGEETEERGGENEEDDDEADYTWSDPLTMALTAAGTLCRVDDMKTLLNKGADPEKEEEDGWLPHVLHGAAIGGNLDAIRLICSHYDDDDVSGIRINCLHTGNSALHFAAQYGHREAVQFFLDADFKPDERNKFAQTPLFLAASAGHTDVVKALLELDYARAEAKMFGPEASQMSDEEYLEMQSPIVDVDADDYRGRTPMGIAVQRGFFDVVERLMWRGELEINHRNAEEHGMTYLMTAASIGHEAIFDHLLGHIDIKKRLKDGSGHGLLKHAAVGGNENIVCKVLSWRNVNVNLRGEDDSTPIMWAALYGHESIVKLLIEHGAAVDLVTRQLHLRMMRFLGVLDEPDTSVLDDQLLGAMTGQVTVLVGASALDAAVHGGHVGMVRLLLSQQGVDINQRDMDDRTPFANAALTGHEGVLRLLLAQGDSVNTE
jgi:ankyrin repeat protein